jgi:hypothetical protein
MGMRLPMCILRESELGARVCVPSARPHCDLLALCKHLFVIPVHDTLDCINSPAPEPCPSHDSPKSSYRSSCTSWMRLPSSLSRTVLGLRSHAPTSSLHGGLLLLCPLLFNFTNLSKLTLAAQLHFCASVAFLCDGCAANPCQCL